jgi:hypothetical protein
MAVPTDQQILDAARTALLEIVSNPAATYTINGRSYGAQDLGKLQKIIDYYENRVSRSGKSPFILGTFRGRCR